MRIDELRLSAWGPFASRTLDLSDGAQGVHFIVGPNEAGKSSALRAISSLLFGVPFHCRDAFVHPKDKLRVGGTLRMSSGKVLDITRRKGNKNTLLDRQEQPLDDAALRPFLGGVDATLFDSLFGIDHRSLRDGGKQLLSAGGHLGQALVAASAGHRDLQGVLEALATESEQLFKASRTKQPTINQKLSDLKDRRDEIESLACKGSRYDAARKTVESLEKECSALAAELRVRVADQSRIERIIKVLPLITERRQALAALEAQQNVVALPDSFAADRTSIEQKLALAKDQERAASLELAGIEQKLGQLVLAPELIEQEKVIGALNQKVGSHDKAHADLTALRARLEQCKSERLSLLLALNRPATADETGDPHIAATTRALILELGRKYGAIQERLAADEAKVTDLQAQIEQAQAALASVGVPSEANALRRAIDQAQSHGDLDRARAMVARHVQETEAQAAQALSALGLWNGPLESVTSLSLPSDSTLERFATGFSQVQADIRSASDRRRQAEEQLAELDKELHEVQLAGPVPTESDLGQARKQRDEYWSQVRHAWEQGQAYDSGAVVNYDRQVSEADSIADRLRRESDRVAKLANCLAAKAKAEATIDKIQRELEALHQQHQQLDQTWRAAWQSASIEPLSPPEMRSWLKRHANVAKLVQTLHAHQSQLAEHQQTMADLTQQLAAELNLLGESVPAAGEAFGPLLRHARSVLERKENQQRLYEQHQKRLDELALEKRRAEAKLETSRAQQADWSQRWEQALAQAGLPAQTTPAEAIVFAEKVQELTAKRQEAEGYRKRIDDIGRDAQAFQTEVAELVALVAPDLRHLSPAPAVSALDARLRDAREAAASRKQLEEARTARQKDRENALAIIADCQENLASMCRQAGCDAVEDLPLAERRSAELAARRQELKTLDGQIAQHSGGTDLETFIAEAQQEDIDTLQARLRELQSTIPDMEAKLGQLQQQLGARREELNRTDGTSQAALAAEEAEFVKAQLREAVERYMRVRLASSILRREIERWRKQHQGPVMKRASELFAQLTDGSFAGLQVSYDHDDEPVIVGVRATGGEIGVEAMSDGTVDQLYLALRLASIEGYVEREEPVPFIVDDVFMTFDDRRSAAAVEALAGVSNKVQVIVFTHHPHLLEIAKQTRAKEVLFEHVL